MGQTPAERKLEDDLEAIARTTGRLPIRAGVFVFLGAGALMLIRWLAGGAPDLFAYGAAAIIMAGVAPALVVLGLDHRSRTRIWLQGEQHVRDERVRAQAIVDEMQRRGLVLPAPGPEPRGRRRPTSRQRALQPVEATIDDDEETL